jgi:hypothetical protein
MTPDERNILQAFLSDLATTPAPARDAEADAMIQQAMQQNPGAAYLLVQHAILADQALHAAQAQLQAQQQQQPAASFLPQQSPYPPASSQPLSPWAGPMGAPVQSSPFAANSGLGSFLRSAGQMAAGVAAGDLLAQGISNIFAPRW